MLKDSHFKRTNQVPVQEMIGVVSPRFARIWKNDWLKVNCCFAASVASWICLERQSRI